MKPVYFFLISLLILILSCTSAQRLPSSVFEENERAINRIQEIDLQLSKYWNNDWKADQLDVPTSSNADIIKPVYDRNILDNPTVSSQVEALMTERQALVNHLSGKLPSQDWTGVGPWNESIFHPRRNLKEETLEIKDPQNFRIANPRKNPFPLEHRLYSSYKLRFENLFTPPNIASTNEDEKKKQYYLKARLECNADIIYDSGILMFSKQRKSPIYEFDWYYNVQNGQRVQVSFSPQVTHCQLKFYDPQEASTWTHSVDLIDLPTLSKEWAKLSQQVDVCARPVANLSDPVSNFFWGQNFNFDTCPRTYEKMTNVRDTYNAINERILSLTGSPLRRKDFDEKNPLAKLDFSKAPHFDIIWVSSLTYSADFYGLVLARALRYHAERGTQIRVITSEAVMKKKDRAILDMLQKDVPNVKIQYYRYRLSDEQDGSWIDRFHRVNHTKLLIGYSASNPKNSFLFTGGRNIHDAYLFKERPIYKAYAFLKDYSQGEEPFIFYQDFEVEIRGQEFIKSVLAQMISFWMRDSQNHSFRSTNINIPKIVNQDELARISSLHHSTPLIRHMLSLPYFDGYQLERFYVEMINSAQSEIVITTPYFRPTMAISAAFERASQRGVKISVMTRIRLAGDGVPKIAEDVNKEGINRMLGHIDIYEWIDDHSIMHAKLMVIDKKLSFISSVNLNGRSFLHDTESGVLILHPKTALAVRSEVLEFIRQGRKITDKERISWINGTLIDWADSFF